MSEPFDRTVADWLNPPTEGNIQRLGFLCAPALEATST